METREAMGKKNGDKKTLDGTKNLLNSTMAKIVAFLLFALGMTCAVIGAAGVIYLEEESYYTLGFEQLVHDRMVPTVWDDVGELKRIYQNYEAEEAEEVAANYLMQRNVKVEVYVDGQPLWNFLSEEDRDTPYHFLCYTSVYKEVPFQEQEREDGGQEADEMPDSQPEGEQETEVTTGPGAIAERADAEEVGESPEQMEQKLTFYVYVDPELNQRDAYWSDWKKTQSLAEAANVFPVMAVVGALTALVTFLFLLWSAGHHRGKEGITESVLSPYHFDLLTVFFGIIAALGLLVWVEMQSGLFWYVALAVLLMLELVWGMIWLRELALRLKLHILFQRTLIAEVVRGIAFLVRGIPLVLNVVLILGGIALAEVFGIFIYGSAELFVLWLLEKMILFPLVIYCALMFRRLEQGSEALAQGDLNYQVDVSPMVLNFRKLGENLNHIGHGMSVAVEQRIKSERLKTELITNVSHDLKTPLTSIINYADLIGSLVSRMSAGEGQILEPGGVVSGMSETVEEGSERQKLSEYAEVLLRQSKRLKKLLDDLMEASKATTGNLEVHLQPCRVGVLLTQAVGEYEARFAERGLELITGAPESEVSVLADGRHIWRVFDNLLNNICKYAQENSRVYLSVESSPQETAIIFRNMSKYPLVDMGEELKERFVRGDKSRHIEGNGLGLSIAESLMELQGGKLDIVTDGDLFKVTIRIPTLQNGEQREN